MLNYEYIAENKSEIILAPFGDYILSQHFLYVLDGESRAQIF